MSASTLEHYSQLAGLIAIGAYPIMPQPTWGQDAAMIAFFVDGLRSRTAELIAALEEIESLDYRGYPHESVAIARRALRKVPSDGVEPSTSPP